MIVNHPERITGGTIVGLNPGIHQKEVVFAGLLFVWVVVLAMSSLKINKEKWLKNINI